LFAEYFRHGVPRTWVYELVDEFNDPARQESNFGLLHSNLSPKPAFTALASLISLLEEPNAPAFSAGALSYAVSAQPSGTLTRTHYVHDLLLQKSGGDFYLLLWHEISDSSFADAAGNAIPGTARDLAPPALSATITLPPQIQTAAVYAYNSSWSLVSTPLQIVNGQVTIPASDVISVVQLTTAPVSVSASRAQPPK
jgi:hypothetical protein